MTHELMTAALRLIVEEAYSTFSAYTIGNKLSVCGCPRCDMTENAERALLHTPLREIPSKVLAAYTGSAHVENGATATDEMRYFFPRYLELIATDDAPDMNGLPACLRRLVTLDWRTTWRQAEIAVADRFFDELFCANLQQIELNRWPVGWRLSFDIGNILALIIIAGADLNRILEVWRAADDPFAAIHCAALRPDVYRDGDRFDWHSPYLHHYWEKAAEIGQFLVSPEMSRRIEASFFVVEDMRLQQILSDGLKPYWPAASGVSQR